MDRKAFGENVREQRIKMKYTQEYLAEKVDITKQYLGELERGKKNPSISTVIRLANSFNTTVDVLIKGEINAAKPYILNEITEKIEHLDMKGIKMVSDVIDAIIKNMDDNR